MNFAYFDASSGLSGDMILGALLDLGISKREFKDAVAELGLPVDVRTRDVSRAGLRGLKVDVSIKKGQESPARHWHDVQELIDKSPFSDTVRSDGARRLPRLVRSRGQSPRPQVRRCPSPRSRGGRRARRCRRQRLPARPAGHHAGHLLAAQRRKRLGQVRSRTPARAAAGGRRDPEEGAGLFGLGGGGARDADGRRHHLVLDRPLRLSA